jgi:hypothetical protein
MIVWEPPQCIATSRLSALAMHRQALRDETQDAVRRIFPIKSPRAKEDITHRPPEQLVASILQKEQRIAEIMGEIAKLVEKKS